MRFNAIKMTRSGLLVTFNLLVLGMIFTNHQMCTISIASTPVGASEASRSSYSNSIKSHEDSYINPPPMSPAPTCTKEQREKITHQLMFQDDEDFKNSVEKDFGRLQHTNIFACPNPTWIDNFYKEIGTNGTTTNDDDHGNGFFLGISVGCNKGHDAIRTARMGLSAVEFDAQKWATEISEGTDEVGICKQEHSEQAKIVAPKRRAGEMHCIEPMPSTFAVLRRASDALDLETQGLVLTHAAISSAQGTVKFPKAMAAGREDIGIGFCNDPGLNKKETSNQCEDVPMYSLERYVDKFVTSKGPVHILQIDVEGWDFDVLFGASSVLDRTHYLEFEYHSSGKWNHLHLPDAVRLLDGKGFTCYWAGNARLWRITECYFEVYNHWHGWSNVACVHRSQRKLSEKMEELFLETLDSW